MVHAVVAACRVVYGHVLVAGKEAGGAVLDIVILVPDGRSAV